MKKLILILFLLTLQVNCFSGTTGNIRIGTSIIVEGSTEDTNELTMSFTDPTTDRTVTFDDVNIDFSSCTTGYVLKYDLATKTWIGGASGTGFSWANTPATETAAGTAGDVAYDQNFIYVCTTTNLWKRAELNGWMTYGVLGNVLQETGYIILQENGDKILREGVVT